MAGDYLDKARAFLKMQVERDRDCVDELILLLRRVEMEARLDERQIPMPYRYSHQYRIDDLRAEVARLMVMEECDGTGITRT